MKKRKALVTGITGQDGSYLAEFLLSKGYEVYGMVRRSSTETFERIGHLMNEIELVQADLLDQLSIINIVKSIRPREIYNLASQSFVPTSFEQPVLTGEFTALGVTRMLEAVKLIDRKMRYYQASSSEMFGMAPHSPQTFKTPFHPRSPYGVAKVYGHWITVNYRESYNLFAVSGILFNHECVTGQTPMIIRKNGLLNCLPIEDILPNPAHVPQRELDFDVWDEKGWTKAKLGTVRWNESGRANDKRIHRVIARCGEVNVTADHLLMTQDGESLKTEETKVEDRLRTAPLPPPPGITKITEDMARFLGLLTAEGYAFYHEGKYGVTFRNNDKVLIKDVADLWLKLFGGTIGNHQGYSGFTGEPTGGIALRGSPGACHWLYEILYTKNRWKKAPFIVLNADAVTWQAFLKGYNDGDGLKKGYGSRQFKNFKTSSPVLAAGLWWMASRVLNQKLTLNVDRVERNGMYYHYYSINLGAEGGSRKGTHLLKPAEEVKQVYQEDYTGWLYDIETESGTFHAGVGNLVIHNSPRRGKEFVTRRISDGVARIKLGLAHKIKLGNLKARRDWGFAGDYVKAMWLMLQQPRPRDFIIATGESHSVKEFAQAAFRHAGLDWRKHVDIDRSLFRPAEVHVLCGDPSEAKAKLKWKPQVDFQGLVRMMVDADLEKLSACNENSVIA